MDVIGACFWCALPDASTARWIVGAEGAVVEAAGAVPDAGASDELIDPSGGRFEPIIRVAAGIGVAGGSGLVRSGWAGVEAGHAGATGGRTVGSGAATVGSGAATVGSGSTGGAVGVASGLDVVAVRVRPQA